MKNIERQNEIKEAKKANKIAMIFAPSYEFRRAKIVTKILESPLPNWGSIKISSL